jgi:hypothetical protein
VILPGRLTTQLELSLHVTSRGPTVSSSIFDSLVGCVLAHSSSPLAAQRIQRLNQQDDSPSNPQLMHGTQPASGKPHTRLHRSPGIPTVWTAGLICSCAPASRARGAAAADRRGLEHLFIQALGTEPLRSRARRLLADDEKFLLKNDRDCARSTPLKKTLGGGQAPAGVATPAASADEARPTLVGCRSNRVSSPHPFTA